MTNLLQSRQEGRLLRLILNRPDKRNALNAALCRELTSALAEAQNAAEIGAILLTGNGNGCGPSDARWIYCHDHLCPIFPPAVATSLFCEAPLAPMAHSPLGSPQPRENKEIS